MAVVINETLAGTVSRIDNNGRRLYSPGAENARSIARTSDGKLIVAEVGAKRLIEIPPDSGRVTEIAANLPIGLIGATGGLPAHIPTGVAVGASGVIYF